MNKVVHFLLTLLIMFAVSIAPAQALLKGGTWQELNSTTGAVNGTAPLADAETQLYRGGYRWLHHRARQPGDRRGQHVQRR